MEFANHAEKPLSGQKNRWKAGEAEMKYEPNTISATLKVVVTGEFYDDEATEETLRYAVEQDLEDSGFDVDVSLMKEQEAQKVESIQISRNFGAELTGYCPSCNRPLKERFNKCFCGDCGQAVKWDD